MKFEEVNIALMHLVDTSFSSLDQTLPKVKRMSPKACIIA